MSSDKPYLIGGAGRAGKPAALAVGTVLLIAAVLIVDFERGNLDLWITVLHVVSVVSWMVGLLYLPRLFAYHADIEYGSQRAELLGLMEFRLLKVIMNPAMIVVWISGVYLMISLGYYADIWMWLKFLTVVVLTGFHGTLAKAVKQFATGENARSSKQWRVLNEVPTVGLFVAVIMVIVKPF